MPIDQLPRFPEDPKIPESTGIDQLDTETVEEEVTWRDFPPPGALLMRAPTDREKNSHEEFWQRINQFSRTNVTRYDSRFR